uniref:CCHC-type domain-containing protein n=1 Tax=Picea glauca TaxID=3330 RepID=A0A101LXY6_PICGL|nr:hypothetical protein ABT39_MTgene5572 [Picea glauca]QHR89570.1 hypothetical protein Q903MT_gene3592 [Picea sitchensis]
MFDALVTLYQSVNLSRIMLLKNKLTRTRMSKIDTIASYLMKITELRDQHVAIGELSDESELVRKTLNGFGLSWHHFVQCICAREKLPTFYKLWDDFIGEETRLETVSASFDEAQDLALIRKVIKGGKKGGFGKGKKKKEDSGSLNHGKKDPIHVKCFKCNKFGHYASKCPEKRGKGNQQQK